MSHFGTSYEVKKKKHVELKLQMLPLCSKERGYNQSEQRDRSAIYDDHKPPL